MTRFLELLMSVLIVVVLFVLVGVFLPDRRTVQHSVETSHPLRQAFDTLNSFKRFGDWNPMRQHDPKVTYTISGAERGVGAQLDHASQRVEVGNGSWHITESEPNERIRYTVYNDSHGQNKNHLITLDQRGKIVEIDWLYSVDYGWSLPGRYAGLYVDRTVGDDIKRSLANIANLLASMPNFDYSNLEVQVTEVAPQNILYITTTADRNITAVENAMDLALKDIRAAITANQLVEAAPPRLITTNFGSEKYEFDVAIPVMRRTEAPADEANGDGGNGNDSNGEEGMSISAQPVDLTPPEALEGLRLPDNVRVGQSYGGRVVTAPYRGHPAALPLIRDQLRSYAATFGEQLQDRAFEEYLTEIADTAAEDARFRVYWPIK
ncbi:hypothetical protein OS187_05820 [Xanthomonadaceae bacterium JHOS43]|nr:hypothetical protein [Xanthomonadaceae bacterium JHOS43]MCX7562473.1 hypothetical protein [Xanthomonadaceae bacterium XH05]